MAAPKPSENTERRMLTIKEAGKLLSLSESTIWRLSREGKLPLVHIGRATRVRLSDLDVYVASLETPRPVFRMVVS
jgi:excisionase family DNA binding protein